MSTQSRLNERLGEFNLKVDDAIEADLNKEDSKENISAIDGKLLQIDLASRHRKIDYILNMIKSGNGLYISRALKCKWIYNDEYSNIINPSYLHHNLFPYMSQKMKTKMLMKLFLYLKNEDRVLCFYSYCVNSKLNRLASKFLIYTPEVFKLDLFTSDADFDSFDNAKCLKNFIGSSLALAAAFVNMHSEKYKPSVVHELRFLYFKYQEDYLDLLEKNSYVDYEYNNILQRFGRRISRKIFNGHKSRVWLDPVLYINKLNKSILIKHLTIENVKYLATLLLPTTSSDFWSIDFYHSYKFMLDLLPCTELFAYLKEIFSDKYKDKIFELDIQFYNLKYYEMLTTLQQQTWALLHIERREELFGNGNDYIWYKFLNIDKALEGVKNYLLITQDDHKRLEIFYTLIDCAKSQDDLTKLLNYFYEKHHNESNELKIHFIHQIVSKHDIYDFTEECWSPFQNILIRLDGFYSHWHLKQFVMTSIIYYVINNKDVPEDLQNYINYDRGHFVYYDVLMALTEERRYLAIKYWLNVHENKFKVLLDKPLDDKVKEDISAELSFVWDVIWMFHRDEKECPETVLTYTLTHTKILDDIYEDIPIPI